jgi:hypothetical protein
VIDGLHPGVERCPHAFEQLMELGRRMLVALALGIIPVAR